MSDIEVKALDRYSYSKISCYSQCHFKWYTKYLEKNFIYNETITSILEIGYLVKHIE